MPRKKIPAVSDPVLDPFLEEVFAASAKENEFLNSSDLRLPKDAEIDFSLLADQFDFSCSTDEAIDIIAANNSLAETEMF